MHDLGCDFALLFGQTEMSPITTLFRPEHQLSHIGAVGTPLTGVQVAIMGLDGELLPAGAQGEIVYRGPSTMAGYLRNEEATEAAFAHGWFHSGDVGWFGDDGMLWFADRHKDVIKTGGENVASIEVEKAVYAADPAIAEAVVVGLPHERWSEAITAVVVPKPGETVDAAALIAALKQRLDGYKVPKDVIVMDELPKTSTGKIQKNDLSSEPARGSLRARLSPWPVGRAPEGRSLQGPPRAVLSAARLARLSGGSGSGCGWRTAYRLPAQSPVLSATARCRTAGGRRRGARGSDGSVFVQYPGLQRPLHHVRTVHQHVPVPGRRLRLSHGAVDPAGQVASPAGSSPLRQAAAGG